MPEMRVTTQLTRRSGSARNRGGSCVRVRQNAQLNGSEERSSRMVHRSKEIQ